MTHLSNYKNVLAVAFLLIAVTFAMLVLQRPNETYGSVAVGNEYQATTTPGVADMKNLCPARLNAASSTTGVLGAVNVLKANTSAFAIYDATTTNVDLRTPGLATSSITLAQFPASATAGSYHFDAEFKYGLLIDYDNAALVSSSTITYRCQG